MPMEKEGLETSEKVRLKKIMYNFRKGYPFL